jgi:hypothetical protein
MNRFNDKKSMTRKWWHLFVLVPLFLLSSCMETIFTVQFPKNGQLYVDEDLVDFVINYTTPVPKADIFLNGSSVGKEFSYGPSQARAPISKIRKYLREGSNTLAVDPLAFGPTVTFMADTKGPDIVVTWGETNGTLVDIKGFLRDPSDVTSMNVRLVQVTGIDQQTGEVTRATGSPINVAIKSDRTFEKLNVDVSGGVTIYHFEATDIHGHTTTKEYLADSSEISSMAISNAVRIAVGDSLVESLRPVIASAMYDTVRNVPIDVRNWCWNNPLISGPPSQNPAGGFCATGQDGTTMMPGLNPVDVDIGLGNMPTTINRLFMASNATMLLNKFKIMANDRLDLDLVITEMTVDLTIDGGWLLGDINMTMTIGRTVVDSAVDVSVVNKVMHTELTDSNFSLENISVSDASIWGIPIGGLVDLIMPLIEGLIADLLPSIINPILEDNLQKLVIGGRVLNIDDLNMAYFDYALNVETLKTDNLFGAGNPYDLVVGLEMVFDLLTQDPNANPMLGPVYVEDPVDLDLIFNSYGATGTNLTVAVSSNALNQAFAALYGAGLTHLTMVDGVMGYGADPLLPVGTDGQTRVRLYPESPPFFTLEPLEGGLAGQSKASVGYESAVLYMDINEGGVWKPQLELGVDIKIAANIVQENEAVKLGIEGSPILNVNTVKNYTALPVTRSMLQALVDVMVVYALPALADQFVILDLGAMAQTDLNGTVVAYLSDQDAVSQTYSHNTNCGAAVRNDLPCVAGKAHVCDTLVQTSGSGNGSYDLVCQEINMVVSTSTVSSIGDKGSNLFFQMEARDPNIPPAPAIPRFDLDGDGKLDYQDNCAVNTLMLTAAVSLEGGLTSANMNLTTGEPTASFVTRVSTHINRWLAKEQGIAESGWTAGSYAPAVAGSGTPPVPSAGNISWWNTMRKGDTAITTLGSYPWIKMLLSNANQQNSDGDRVGELCEDDRDRDGLYTDNGNPKDACTTYADPTNNPGYCAIDLADFVLFKNEKTGWCLDHNSFTGATNAGNSQNFDVGHDANGFKTGAHNSTDGTLMSWDNCNPNDLGQRFYVELSSADASHINRFAFEERIVHIYTNEWKQVAPGFYDLVNMHYLASTIASPPNAALPAGSSYWGAEDVIVTTMVGYDGNWRQWILSASERAGYPYLIESNRVWDIYGKSGGITPGRRDCIFSKNGYLSSTWPMPDADAGSCFESDAGNRNRAAFKALLGPNQVEWTGRFGDD